MIAVWGTGWGIGLVYLSFGDNRNSAMNSPVLLMQSA